MKDTGKTRLDVWLVERGEYPSRESAKRAIMAGLVSVGGEVVDKPGTVVSRALDVIVKRADHAFVSRGGLKLERALDAFAVDVTGRVVLDVGASTGGFTDCALQHGATLVHAVDVGYGQFAWKLRQDARVRLYERTNFRHVDPSMFDPTPTLAVMDVSFISIRLLLPKLHSCLGPSGEAVCLVKPQFEAGRGNVGKGGIVRDPAVHQTVLANVIQSAGEAGFACANLTYSPIEGGDGNLEFLIHLTKADASSRDTSVDTGAVVRAAWEALKQVAIVLDTSKES